MKKLSVALILIFVATIAISAYGQNVGINTNVPNTTLHITDTGHVHLKVATEIGEKSTYFTLKTKSEYGDLSLKKYSIVQVGTMVGIPLAGKASIITGEDTEGLLLGTLNQNASLNIITGGQERIRINGGGFIGIGTPNPLEKIDVYNPIKAGLRLRTNGDLSELFLENSSGADFTEYKIKNQSSRIHHTIRSQDFTTETTAITIDQNARIGVRTQNPTEALDVAGSIKTSGLIKPNGSAGAAGQVLTNNGNGTMQWAAAAAINGGEEINGNGTWGTDCAFPSITAYQPAFMENVNAGARFGASSAISGDYAIVGADLDNESGLTACGSVTIFKRNPTTGNWEHHSKIYNPSASSGDNFGFSVAIDGDYAIVGARNDDENGNTNCGSATILRRNPISDVWEVQGMKLTNPNSAPNDDFGYSVSINGSYAIVGAYGDDTLSYNETGSASIFKLNLSNIWVLDAKLWNPVQRAEDYFGFSVSINGASAIVGAPYDDETSGVIDEGSVTIFTRSPFFLNVWLGTKIPMPIYAQNYDNFGYSVSIYGNYAAVGNPLDDNGGAVDAGSVFVFKRNSTGWDSYTYISSPDGGFASVLDGFGNNVSLSNDLLIIGAWGDGPDNGVGEKSGSAYIFRRYGNNYWHKIQKINRPYNERIGGNSVAIEHINRRFLIGASNFLDGTGMVHFGKLK